VGRYSLPALFSVLTVGFGVIAVAAAANGSWVVAIAAGGIGAWMANFAVTGLRRMRR
jgi:hypothetical protein